MSIYSGFANRQLESNYNRLIEGTLRILQGRLLKFYEEFAEEDKNFVKLLSKNVSYLAIMERNKYLPPKLSECLRDICTFLKIEIPSNEQQQVSGNLHSPQQGGLQRNNSFNRQSYNNSPTQQNYKRVFSPIHNDNSTLKRSISPSQMRSISPRGGGNNMNYNNSKQSLSPHPQNSIQYSSKKTQNNNLRTTSPRGGVAQNQNRIYNYNQNSYSTLKRDNSRGHIQQIPAQSQNGYMQQQQYSKINPNYLYNYNQKKQMPPINKQQNNRSQSPRGGYIQGYSNVNNSYQSNSRNTSPRLSSNNLNSQNQQRLSYNTNQKNNTISEGNSQFYDYHINDRKNSSVQGRNFRMKTLNNSPSNQDYNYNPMSKRNNSSQIQKELSHNFGLVKKNNMNMQKRNSLSNKMNYNNDRNNQENYNYNPNVQNDNQMQLTKQKIKQGLELNQNDYSLVDETITQMRKQINIYCKQNKSESNPFEISPSQQLLASVDSNHQTQQLVHQLAQQDQIMNDDSQQMVIETRSYSIAKRPIADNSAQ